MKIGPIVHGGLLIVALIVAYKGWTKEEKQTADLGEVAVWAHPAAKFTGIAYDAERKATKVTWRGEGDDRYLWGEVTRSTSKAKPKDPHKKDESADKEDATEETETTTRSFPIDGEAGDELLTNFSELKALSELGVLDDAKKKEYGLTDSKENLSVSFGDKQETLVIGSRVYGGSDRYVLHADSDKAFVISSKVIRPVEAGETTLRLKKLHAYEDDAVGKITVTSDPDKQEILRIEVNDEKGSRKAWAKADAPDKPDLTIDSFLDRADKLSPIEYVEDPGATKVVHISYRDDKGTEIGFLEFSRKVPPELAEPSAMAPDEKDEASSASPGEEVAADTKEDNKSDEPVEIEYFVRSEKTRVWGRVSRLSAERFDQDVATLFEREPPPTTPAGTDTKDPPPAVPPIPGGPSPEQMQRLQQNLRDKRAAGGGPVKPTPGAKPAPGMAPAPAPGAKPAPTTGPKTPAAAPIPTAPKPANPTPP